MGSVPGVRGRGPEAAAWCARRKPSEEKALPPPPAACRVERALASGTASRPLRQPLPLSPRMAFVPVQPPWGLFPYRASRRMGSVPGVRGRGPEAAAWCARRKPSEEKALPPPPAACRVERALASGTASRPLRQPLPLSPRMAFVPVQPPWGLFPYRASRRMGSVPGVRGRGPEAASWCARREPSEGKALPAQPVGWSEL